MLGTFDSYDNEINSLHLLVLMTPADIELFQLSSGSSLPRTFFAPFSNFYELY
jgi:hypothetical protein